MKIIGMNTTVDDFDENNVTVDTLIENLKTNLRNYNIDERYFKLVVDLYNKIFTSTPEKMPEEIIKEGTLFHFTPVYNKASGEILYDKVESIAKNGLLSLDMLTDLSDGTDSAYVSFHSVLKGEKTLKDVMSRLSGDDRAKDIGYGSLKIFINTETPAIQELLKLGRVGIDDYNDTRLEDMINLKFADWEIIKKMFVLDNIWCPDAAGSPGVCYLPIGVPSSYICAVVIPKSIQKDEKLLSILKKGFINAKLLDDDGNEIQEEQETERE